MTATDQAILTAAERAALAECLGSVTLTPGIWAAPGHMDKVAAAVEAIVATHVAAERARVDAAWRARFEALPVHRMKVGWANYSEDMVVLSDLRALFAEVTSDDLIDRIREGCPDGSAAYACGAVDALADRLAAALAGDATGAK